MLINFTKPLTDLDGKPLKNGDKDFNLRLLSTNALLAPDEEDKSLSGEKKVERAVLAQQIHTNEEVDMSAEQITLLKKLIARMYTPLAVMRAYELLDPKAEDQ